MVCHAAGRIEHRVQPPRSPEEGRPARPVEPVIPAVIQPEPEVKTDHVEVVVDSVAADPILQLCEEYPVLADISEYKPYDRSQVLRRDERAKFVYFPLAKTDIQPEWRDNQKTLDQIVEATEKLLALKDVKLSKIQIVGLASFDGGVKFNEKIAQGRADALKKYIQDRLSVSDDQFDVAYGGEDWVDFRDQMEEAIANGDDHAAELQKVIDIIDREPDLARREQQIRKLRGGHTYQYIKEHYLGDQRNSGYLRVYYDNQ